MKETGFYRILAAIETDATRYYGPDAVRPGILEPAEAEQMLAHIAADLTALLPDISSCSLIAPGALFDQTQVLRPGFPVFDALENVSLKNDAERFRPGLVSIGAGEGRMPVTALQPDQAIPPGLLQLLPIVVHGPAETVQQLGQAMEYRFLEEGQLSAHTASWLQSAFDIEVTHARLMTLTDLNAMLRMQLDHFGFLPLWELLDAALTGREEPLRVSDEGGAEFEWRDGAVHTRFQTFDYWASRGAGAGLEAGRQALADAYSSWTRTVRQYLTTLGAHGLALHFHNVHDGALLEGTFFTEQGLDIPGSRRAAITEHSFSDLGVIAVTAVTDSEVLNYYPLKASGLNDLHAEIRARLNPGHTVSFPGTLLYDEEQRCLIADTRMPSSDN
jgi:hypothetical protein